MSNLLKKSFLISMVVMTAMWGVAGVVNVASANMASAGDLIKSASSPAVYYLDASNVKHPFHHEREYMTWYDDFSGVVTVPTDEMVSYTLGSTVIVRPGSRLVQYVEVLGDATWSVSNTPEVYAAGPSGALSHLDSAETAVALYGSNWESMIVPLPNYLAANYTTGDDLTSSSLYPTGTLVKTAASTQIYYVDGSNIRPVTDEGFTANRFNLDYVVTASDISGYTESTSLTSLEGDIANPIAGAGSTAVGTGLTVALASTTPGASVTPMSATNVPLMKFNLTASADGAVTVNSITAKRLGVGASADFSYLYLYDGSTRLTNGKTLNSTTHSVQFTSMNLQVAAGATRTLTLSADIAASGTGDVHYFSIASDGIATSASLNGSFPVQGSTLTIGSVSAGSIKAETNGTLANPAVGQQDVKVAQFKLTAGTGEDLNIQRITLYEGGSINNGYLTDLKLYQNTTLLASAASTDSSGYIVFDLTASPYLLSKNTNRVFHMTADISTSARNGDTIKTYIDQTTDIYALGALYGFGATVYIGDNTGTANDGTYDGTGTNYSTVTVQGGQITLAMNGPTTGTISIGTAEAVLMNFSITSGVNAEIRSMRVELHKTGTDLGVTGDCASGTDYIANVKVIDVDNGDSTSAVNCGSFTNINSTTNGLYKTYTDYFTLTAGETRNFAIKADLNSSLTAGTYYATLGSSYTSYYTFSSTAIKNLDNNQYVTDIVPTTFTQGNNQTVSSAGLRVSLASNAVGTTVVQGTNNVTLAEFALEALEGSSITISGMTLYGYVDGDGVGATSTDGMSLAYSDDIQEAGMAAVGSVYVNNLVDNLKLYDKTADSGLTTNLNSTTESFASATGAATFSNMNWTIPAGETHVLVVKGNVVNSAFSNGDTGDEGTLGMQKYVKVNFASSSAITAVDESSNTITMSNSSGTTFTCANANGTGDTCGTAVAAGLYAETGDAHIVITASGTLNVVTTSQPSTANVVAGTSDVPVLNLQFSAAYESFNVNKLRISQTQATTYNRAVDSVTISYPNAAGTIVTANQTLLSGNADFNITSAPIYVAAGSNVTVNVYFNLKAINNNQGAYTGDIVKATFDANGNFEARGTGSSSTHLTASSSGASADVTGNVMTLHGNVPIITADTTNGVALSNAPAELYRWSVTAAEGSFPVNLKKLSFKMTMTDSLIAAGYSTLTLTNFKVSESSDGSSYTELTQADTGTNGYQVYNGYGVTTTVATGLVGGKLSNTSGKMIHHIAGQGALGASATATQNVIVVFNDDRQVPAGQTRHYKLIATASNVDTGATTNNDSISVYMPNLDTSTTSYTHLEASCDGAGATLQESKYCLSSNGTANDTAAYLIWSDSTGTTGDNSHIDVSADYVIATDSTHSTDWFNGYNLKTLDTTRIIQ